MLEKDVVLGTVPKEKAFYFYSDVGNYTGKSAASLKEFADKLQDVGVKSLGFHLRRGDFENWFADVLKDDELARRIRGELRATNLKDDEVRNRLRSMVTARIEQLKRAPVAAKISDLRVQPRWEKTVTR